MSRVGADRTEYMVAFNNDIAPQTVSVPTYSASMAFAPIYPAAGPSISTGADKALQLTVPALSAVVFKAAEPLAPPASAPTITISKPADGSGVSAQAEVVADVTVDPPAAVTFAESSATPAGSCSGPPTMPRTACTTT